MAAVTTAVVVVTAAIVIAVRGCAGPVCDPVRYPDGGVTIATGGTQGVYYGYGSAYASALRGDLPGLRVRLVASAGSVDNLQRLAEGTSQLAFISADTADRIDRIEAAARRGTDIRALARVYDEYVQIVVRADSTIDSLDDLRGRTVSTGSQRSSVEVTAGRLLEAAGMNPDRDLKRRRLGIDDSVSELRAGRLDAFFWVGGLPTRGIVTLAGDVPLRLLPVASYVNALRRFGTFYRPATVPSATYKTRGDTATIAVPSYLLVAGSLDDDLVFRMTSVLFSRRSRIGETVASARLLDPRSAISTEPVALHPGAERYYRSIKP